MHLSSHVLAAESEAASCGAAWHLVECCFAWLFSFQQNTRTRTCVQTLSREFIAQLTLPHTGALLERGPAGMRAHEEELAQNVQRLARLRDAYRVRHAQSRGTSLAISRESNALAMAAAAPQYAVPASAHCRPAALACLSQNVYRLHKRFCSISGAIAAAPCSMCVCPYLQIVVTVRLVALASAL